jgi:hypothetical protein
LDMAPPCPCTAWVDMDAKQLGGSALCGLLGVGLRGVLVLEGRAAAELACGAAEAVKGVAAAAAAEVGAGAV